MIPSEALGPALLSLLLVPSFILAAGRANGLLEPAAVVRAASLTLALQALHVGEEFWAGFQHDFPALFRLQPWSDAFFVGFNLAWISLWSLAIRAVASARANLPAAGVLWFLGLAAIGNAVWHPLLSLLVGRYFPGTVTAIPLGACGLALVRALGRREAEAEPAG